VRILKILHTSDWHLGKRLYNRDRLPEQRLILDEIHEIAEAQQVDVIIVAGDLFDVANPSNEATELFYKALKKMSKNGHRPVIAIAGNHDSPQRIEAPDPLARENGIIFMGFPNSTVPVFEIDSGLKVIQSEKGFVEIKLPNQTIPLRLLLTPYASEIRMKQFLGKDEEEGLREALQKQWKFLAEKYCNTQGVNMAMAHLFVWNRDSEPPEEPEGEKPVKIGNASVVYADLFPERLQYVALGHLHRSQEVKGGKVPVFYSGSPLAYSFSESGQEKYVHVIDATPAKAVSVEKVELKKGRRLLRKTFEEVAKAVDWLEENKEAFTEITMRTNDFLTADQNKLLRDASENLVNIIPEPQNRIGQENQSERIDMNQSVSELFKKYFVETQEQEPNEEIMSLFNEILNQKESK
jgi:exonuclease SbcD